MFAAAADAPVCLVGVPDVAVYALALLDPDDAARLEAHLGWCAECARELEELLAVVGVLARVRRQAVSCAPVLERR